MASLVADSVGKSFGTRRVLSSASLRLVGGEVRVLLGRNGAGKSTLLNIASGLVQPQSGVIFVDGRAFERVTLNSLARVGLLFIPDRHFFSSAVPVGKQLEFFQARFDGDPAKDVIARLSLDTICNRRSFEMSGGERRRAEVAAALVRRPRFLLADEPFRGIDPRDSEVLSSIYRELANRGCAVMISGHEVSTLLAVADHVTLCDSGTTYELGTPSVAVLDPRLREGYLGS